MDHQLRWWIKIHHTIGQFGKNFADTQQLFNQIESFKSSSHEFMQIHETLMTSMNMYLSTHAGLIDPAHWRVKRAFCLDFVDAW